MPRRRTRTTVEELTPEALKKLVDDRWGEDTMMFASDLRLRIERIPCGVLSIDSVLGGGFPRGRHTEMFGSFAVGKTYLSQRLISNAQALGLNCAYVDVEKSFDPAFAKHIGINLKKLALHRQRHGNQIIDFMETLLRSGTMDVIVLDSIAALLPKSEMEADMEAGSYGTAQAKLMSAALRRLTTANSRTALVYINQTRDSIGSVFAKRSITSGGRAMGFYAGVRLELVRVENVKKSSKVVDPSKGDLQQVDRVSGHRVLVRVEKDKVGGARTGDQTTFVFDYDRSTIDHIEDLIYLGRVQGLVHKSGNSWWCEGYEDEKQLGRPRFKKWLARNRAVSEELEETLRSNIRSALTQDEGEADGD